MGTTSCFDLSTCNKVVIIDDTPEDAAPLVSLFSNLGVSLLLFSSQQEVFGFNKEQHIHPNIIFADLRFQGQGTYPEDRVAKQCIAMLEVIIDNESAPYLLVLWSGSLTDSLHEEIESLVDKLSVRKPIKTIPLDKTAYKSGESYDKEKLQEAIGKNLEDINALNLLWEWGSISHNAVDKLMGRLAPEANNSSAVWNEDLLLNFAHAADLGKMEPTSFQDSQTFVKNAWLTFSSALSGATKREVTCDIDSSIGTIIDHRFSNENNKNCYLAIETNLNGKNYYFAEDTHHKILKTPKESKKICDDEIEQPVKDRLVKSLAGINLALRMDVLDSSSKEIVPGTICAIEKSLHKELLPDTMIHSGFSNAASNCIAILWTEMTPLCDYSNDKHLNNFFICTLVWAKKPSNRDTERESVYTLGPINLQGYEEPVYLLFDYRHCLMIPRQEIIKHEDAIKKKGQIGETALSDIRFHYIKYIGRLGI